MSETPAWPADKVERRAVESLIGYAKNARLHSKKQVAQIAASITEYGWTIPALIDEQGVLIAGHGRILAAKQLKIDSIPVMVATGWTEDQVKSYRLADNALAEQATWAPDLLKIELGELRSSGYDLNLTGFSPSAVKSIFEPAYSRKIATPVYTPSDTVPKLADLLDETKTSELRREIAETDLPPDIVSFLRKAADRHTVFNFQRIADYYAAAPPRVQRLMEKSALVIIDFNAAIEHGFVKITDRLQQLADAADGA